MHPEQAHAGCARARWARRTLGVMAFVSAHRPCCALRSNCSEMRFVSTADPSRHPVSTPDPHGGTRRSVPTSAITGLCAALVIRTDATERKYGTRGPRDVNEAPALSGPRLAWSAMCPDLSDCRDVSRGAQCVQSRQNAKAIYRCGASVHTSSSLWTLSGRPRSSATPQFRRARTPCAGTCTTTAGGTAAGGSGPPHGRTVPRHTAQCV